MRNLCEVTLVSLVLAGCGGNDFHTLFGPEPDASGDEIAAGGAHAFERPETGGQGTGGAPTMPEQDAGTGGAAEDGGTSASGGAEPVATGGTSGEKTRVDGPDGCVPVTHHNGLGQTWEDCVPLGTYNAKEAAKACIAYTGNANLCFFAPGCGDAMWIIQGADPTGVYDMLWGYVGNTAGYVGVNGGCPTAGSGKPWF